jgi:hypothetical protein
VVVEKPLAGRRDAHAGVDHLGDFLIGAVDHAFVFAEALNEAVGTARGCDAVVLRERQRVVEEALGAEKLGAERCFIFEYQRVPSSAGAGAAEEIVKQRKNVSALLRWESAGPCANQLSAGSWPNPSLIWMAPLIGCPWNGRLRHVKPGALR